MISIEKSAFSFCTGLESVVIPNNVLFIGERAFYYCNNLVSLTISEKLKIVYMQAFCNCSKLENITIPATVEVIYQEAFAGCSSLQQINALPTTPPLIYDKTFSNYSVPLNVPSGCVEAYKNAEHWKNFTNISDKTANPSHSQAQEYAVYDKTTGTLTFIYGEKPEGEYIYEIDHLEYDDQQDRYVRGWYFYIEEIKKVIFDSSYIEARPTSTNSWFRGASALAEIVGLENLNTSNVRDMSLMFASCSGITSLDLSMFITDNVTNMSSMFSSCSGLTSLNISKFNTSNVTDMRQMFHGCSGLTSLDVSNFDTKKVIKMGGMFQRCEGLTSLDVSNFNTSNVERMEHMFDGCSSLTSLDVSNFNIMTSISLCEVKVNAYLIIRTLYFYFSFLLYIIICWQ